MGQESAALLHPYWRHFDKVSSSYQITVGIIMIFVTVGAIAGNGVVIWSFISFRSLRTSSNVFIINLSVANLLMTTIDFPLLVVSSFLEDWPFGHTGCQIYAALTGLCGLVTINSLTAIAIDRYRAVVTRINTAGTESKTKTYKAILFIWSYASVWAICPVVGWNRYQLEGVRSTCSFDYLSRDPYTKSFILSIAVCEFAIPVLLIIIAYVKILTAMVVRRRNLSLRNNDNISLNYKMQRYRVKAEIRTAFIIIGLVCLFVVSWLPYTITAMIGLYGDQRVITPYLTALAGLIAKTSTVYNPIVYAITHPKFKTKIKCILCRADMIRSASKTINNSRFSSNKMSSSSQMSQRFEMTFKQTGKMTNV